MRIEFSSSLFNMSRNKEKSQSALHRFQKEQNRQAGVLETNPNLRPKYVQKEKSLPQAEKWRQVVMTEVSTKLTAIQDPLLEDQEIRELNESINKLFREQRAWEYHIKSLGGPDYIKFGKDLQSTGLVDPGVSGIKGFRYFGRARELPEVRQLQEIRRQAVQQQQSPGSKKQDTRELETKFANLDPYYFTPFVVPNTYNEIVEQVNGMVSKEHMISDTSARPVEKYDFSAIDKQILNDIREESRTGEISAERNKAETIINFEALPTTEEVQAYMVEKKKQELLSKYS